MTRREFRKNIIFNLYKKDLLPEANIKLIDDVGETYLDILSKLAEIDQVISNNLTNYSLNRLAFLDRAIIRLATYEMMFTDVPKEVIINEALELTKEYSDINDKQRRFTNKLLDTIKKSLGDSIWAIKII